MKMSIKRTMTEQEYVLSLIQEEIDSLEKYKWNLKRFSFYEIRKNANFSKKFYKIYDEVERVAIEVNNLEKQRSELLTIMEQFEKSNNNF